MTLTSLVSVAEFITVRFQLTTTSHTAHSLMVSVAEFITVRFQLKAGALMLTGAFSFQ